MWKRLNKHIYNEVQGRWRMYICGVETVKSVSNSSVKKSPLPVEAILHDANFHYLICTLSTSSPLYFFVYSLVNAIN